MFIIDAHCHYGSGVGLNGPWDTRASLENYLRWANESGIERTVLLAALGGDYRRGNLEVARMVNNAPDRFWGFVFVNPLRDKNRVLSIVGKAVESWGFKGIKVHRSDANISREICETAQRFQLPVLYDVMGQVEKVELLAMEYPRVSFIIPHLGSFADDWKAQLNFIPMLERHKNIYTDTSGVKRFDLLQMAVRRAGAHKVIFGSDGPWLHPSVELEKIFALKLPPDELDQVLGGNIIRLVKGYQNKPEGINRTVKARSF